MKNTKGDKLLPLGTWIRLKRDVPNYEQCVMQVVGFKGAGSVQHSDVYIALFCGNRIEVHYDQVDRVVGAIREVPSKHPMMVACTARDITDKPLACGTLVRLVSSSSKVGEDAGRLFSVVGYKTRPAYLGFKDYELTNGDYTLFVDAEDIVEYRATKLNKQERRIMVPCSEHEARKGIPVGRKVMTDRGVVGHVLQYNRSRGTYKIQSDDNGAGILFPLYTSACHIAEQEILIEVDEEPKITPWTPAPEDSSNI